MSEPIRCARCGGPLPQHGEVGGRCPRCMFELGFESSFGEAENPKPAIARDRPSVIGRYRILGLIGEGGMGSVYEAEQEHPRRTVALKIIKLGMASPELLRRFEQESQALGRLQHPGIAQIYEAGTVDTGFGPQPYFAMEFVRGRSPREYAEAHNLTTRDRLEMVAKICDGVHHAHQRGLIHRDLKPGNILVDDTGQPKILDFGVARVTDSDARATQQTDVGQLVGTLAYMSPEQALADPLDIDIRTDVYALGVILHELLSGQLPYPISKKIHETIQTIREQEPARLAAVNRSYRGDIETIVAKALEKDRARRYASAAEMAADIHRHLNDEPIVARRPSARYQLQKFARRNRALVAGTAGVFLVLIAGVITTSWLLARTTKERDRALRAESLANENGREAAEARVNEREQRDIAEARRIDAERQTAVAEAQTVVAQQALSDVQVNLYHSHIDSADHEGWASNVSKADRLLEEAPIGSRNWEWHYLARRNHMEDAVVSGHRDAILAMALGPDGKRLRTVSADNTVKEWDLETRKELSTATTPGTIIKRVALGDNGRILSSWRAAQDVPWELYFQLRDLVTGKTMPSLPFSVGDTRALSPNGTRAAALVVERTPPTPVQYHLRCWDTGTGIELFAPLEQTGPISHLIFSPDGSMLAVMGNGVRILSVTTGQEIVAFGNPQDTFTSGAFSWDNTTFVAGVSNEGLRAWRALDGRQLWSIPGANVNSIAWSPDSRYIAAAGTDQTIRLLDSARGRETARLVGHAGAIHALVFTASGTQLVSAGDDRLIHIWSLREQRPPLILNPGSIENLTVSPDGETLWVATGTGMKSWDTHTGLVGFERDNGPSKWKWGFGGDGGPLVLLNKVIAGGDRGLTGRRGEIAVLDARSGREIAVFDRPEGSIEDWDKSPFLVSPNARRFALASLVMGQQGSSSHTEIEIREASISKRSINFQDKGAIGLSPFSPDGKLVALGSKSERRVEIYDTTAGRRLQRLDVELGRLGGPPCLLFSPVGNQLAVVESGRAISIWDALTGRRLASTREVGNFNTKVVDLAFSPDGTRLASVSSDGEVWLWDTKTGKELILLRESSGPYVVREVTVITTNPLEWVFNKTAPRGSSLDGGEIVIRSLSFSRDGGKIILSTVSPTTASLTVRVETWDGTPRQR